jgi:hypothetical protein
MRQILIVACCLALTTGTSAQSARAPEYEVKAAFLFNFAKFVDWPAQAFAAPSAPLHICVLGRDPFGDALSRIVQGKFIAGRPIVRRQVESAAEARACHILFLSLSDPASLKQALEQLRDAPVLTVGEDRNFLSLGGMINFVLEEERVRFEINLAAAERHHLRVSSKLLAVARVVNVGGGSS